MPVDFQTEPLAERLRQAGIDFDRAAFYSWLGVTPYLEAFAIDDVLRVIASGGRGTEVVLSFAPAGDTPTAVAAMAAAVGEEFRSQFTPASLDAKLRQLGFGEVDFLTPADAAARYFANRGEGLTPPRRVSIVRARV